VLAPAEARALPANTLGAQRVGAEPEAGERLADRAPVYPWRCASPPPTSPLGPAGHSPTSQPNRTARSAPRPGFHRRGGRSMLDSPIGVAKRLLDRLTTAGLVQHTAGT
jgi:hypothetical protein